MSYKPGVKNVPGGSPIVRESGSVKGSGSRSERLIADINHLLSSVSSSRAHNKPTPCQSRPHLRRGERVQANQGAPRSHPVPSRPRQSRHQTPPKNISSQPRPRPVNPVPNSRKAVRHPSTCPRRNNDGDVRMTDAPGSQPQRPSRKNRQRVPSAIRVVDVEMQEAPPLPIEAEVVPALPTCPPFCLSITYCHEQAVGTDDIEMPDAPPLVEE